MTDALPTANVDALAAEAATIAIGLKNILAGEPTWHATERHFAAQLPKAIRAMLLKFMTESDRPEGSDLPKYNHRKVQELLDEGPTEKQAMALMKAVDDQPLAQAIAANATRMVHQLYSMFPRPTRTSLVAGNVPVPATPAAERAFARTWSVACDPLVVLRDLLEGCLDPTMVRAFEQLYPQLYSLTLEMVPEVFASIKAKRPKFELSGTKDRALGMLQGRTQVTSNLPLAAEFQAISQPQTPAPPAPRPSAPVSTNLQTPGQRS